MESPLNLTTSKFICGPMVRQSELAFRQMIRGYGVVLVYSPMINAKTFAKADANERRILYDGGLVASDRPLITQFCCTNADDFVQAAKFVEDSCDGVDLNCGCPQSCAEKGGYGAFLPREKIPEIVRKAKAELKIPVSCKIRIFDNIEDTVALAQAIEAAGASMLAVHGRTRAQKHHKDKVNWEAIRIVKSVLKIPVIANGGVHSLDQARECLEYTGADAVMVATGLLTNPRMFKQVAACPFEMAKEYLDFADGFPPVDFKCVRDHVWAILESSLQENHDLLKAFAAPHFLNSTQQCREAIKLLEYRCGKHDDDDVVLTMREIKYLGRLPNELFFDDDINDEEEYFGEMFTE